MTKAAIYIRSSMGDHDRQREELFAKFGVTLQIVAEYRDDGPGSTGLNKLLEDAAKGKFDVLLCSDLTRLTRSMSLEIVTALRGAGVKVVTADGGELGFADLVAHTLMHHLAKTYSQHRSERIKRGIRAARERRSDEADAGSGSE